MGDSPTAAVISFIRVNIYTLTVLQKKKKKNIITKENSELNYSKDHPRRPVCDNPCPLSCPHTTAAAMHGFSEPINFRRLWRETNEKKKKKPKTSIDCAQARIID